MGWYAQFKAAMKRLKRQVLSIYYAVQDPRTPWYAKLMPFLVLTLALSPLDIIPDFIPILGVIDDLILIPALIYLAIQLIPEEVMRDARLQAETQPLRLSRSWGCAVLIFVMWVGCLGAASWYLLMRYGNEQVKLYTPLGLAVGGILSTVLFVVWLVLELRKEARKRQAAERQTKQAPVEAPGDSPEGDEAATPEVEAAVGPSAGDAGDEEQGLRQPLLSNAAAD